MSSKFFGRLFLLAVAASSLCPQRLALAVQNWNNVNTGDWFLATNWTPAGIPNNTQAAAINNGGVSTASAGGPISALQIDVGKNGGSGTLNTSNVDYIVQTSFDIGDVESTFAVGPIQVTSSGSATITDAASLLFGASGVGDVNVGQTSAGAGATATGTADLTVLRIGDWQIPGDLDLGQTSGSGTATGTGAASIADITGQLSVDGDLDVGQTSGAAGSNNSGDGTLELRRAVEVVIGADFDVAQSTGAGQSSGHGSALIQDVGTLTIGDSLDVAKIRAFETAFNSGSGVVTFEDLDAYIGFETANPGSIEIARVLTSESARGVGMGTLILDQADVRVANDVIVGELALGGPNSASSASGMLQLTASRLDTRDFSVAVRLDATAGTLQGAVELDRSLLIVQSLLHLGPTSTMRMTIDGTVRSLGDGLAGEYAAIDADSAALDGMLAVETSANYSEPAVRGDVDTFELIKSLFGISGAFDEVTYNGVVVNSSPAYTGSTSTNQDGLFVSVVQDGTQVVMSAYLALVGDANGDQTVDDSDFRIWNTHKFTSNTNWASGDFNGDGVTDGHDLLLWNANKFTSVAGATVPEPTSTAVWILLGGLAGLWRIHRDTVLTR